LRVFHKGLILVGVPFLLAVIVIALMFASILKTDRERLEEAQMRVASEKASHLMIYLYDAGFSFQQAVRLNNPKLKQKFKEDIILLRAEQDALIKLDPTDHSRQAMTELNEVLEGSLDSLRNIVNSFSGDHMSLRKLLGAKALQADFGEKAHALSAKIQANVSETLQFIEGAPERQKRQLELEKTVLISAVIGSLLAGLFLVKWFMSAIATRLLLIMDNTLRLSRGEQLHPLIGGNDEISAVDKTFHTMAEELTQARARERALFENASDIICVFDEQGRFTAVNPACQRILSYSPSELLGTELLQYVHPDDLIKTTEAIAETRSTEPAATIENRLTTKGGRFLDLAWSIYWSDLDEALYAVAHDITERKQLERAKEDFLSMVSHDLRSPLSSIFGTFKLITAGAFGSIPQSASEKINESIANVNRLLGLINDLLDVEKLEAGELQLSIESTSVDEWMKRAISELEPIADQRGIKIIQTACGQDFPVDADRMMQVLSNLLSNAIKFSSDNSTVDVLARVDADKLELSIVDTGCGIPFNQQQQIFERFKQVDAAGGRRKGGTGLGLPISKQIVEAHGGSIGVEGVEGTGSRFWVRVPRTGKLNEGSTAISTTTSQVPRARDPVVATSRSAARSSFFDNLSLMQKGMLLVFLPVIFEVIFAGTLFGVLNEAFNEKQQELHQRLIATNAANLLLLYYKLGTAMSIQDRMEGWRAFESSGREILISTKKLEQLTANDEFQHKVVVELQKVLEPGNRFIDHAIGVVARDGTSDSTIEYAFVNHANLEGMAQNALGYIEQLTEHPHAEVETSSRIAELRGQQSIVLLGGLLASTIICLFSALLFGTGITRRLSIVEGNAKRLQDNQPLNAICPGRDEVTHMDEYFHNMAAALKEASRKERAVFDNAHDVLSGIEPDGIVSRMNPACERIFGRRTEEVIGKSIVELAKASDKERFKTALQEVCSTEETRSIEIGIERSDGSECFVLWSLAWSASERNIVAMAHDITQRKQLERMKQGFLSMVSHDLRTPLAAVQVTTEMLAAGIHGTLPEKAAQQLSVVVRNCDRLLSLSNDLLDIEKLQSGNMSFVLRAVSAAEVLQETQQALDTMARQKNIAIVVEPCTSLIVNADADRLVQVGVNLLSNAIKFSPTAGTVTLSAVPRDGLLEFRVHDEGRGIPEAFRQSIFERYKQVSAADGKRSAGTGLGLPICKQIVEQHGGEIGVDSEEGKGSTFWFRIPLVEAVTENQPLPAH